MFFCCFFKKKLIKLLKIKMIVFEIESMKSTFTNVCNLRYRDQQGGNSFMKVKLQCVIVAMDYSR